MAHDCEVIFTQRAFNAIVTETADKHPVETGGVLLGYVLDTGVWVVVENIAPGYLARHRLAEFSYDRDFTTYLANVVNRQYEGELRILGLWHRHPGSWDAFSPPDDETNLRYAQLSPQGALSALVNCDPRMRLTMYHVDSEGRYTCIPWMVDDGTLIPAAYTALRYTTADNLPYFGRKGVTKGEQQEPPGPPPAADAAPPPWKKPEGREVRALVPTDLAGLAGAGQAYPLKGYYVADTRLYNIFPAHLDTDEAHTQVMGYLFPARVLARLGEDVEARVAALTGSADTAKSPMERLRKVLTRGHGKQPVRRFSLQDLGNALGELYGMAPEAWWHQQFLPALNGREGAATLLGERCEDGSLRFVRLGSMIEVRAETYSLKLDVFSRNTGILESDVMLGKGAILIGCGSVGSLVAVELAKAGVGRFLLVDNDIFAYHNICRHQCGIYDVGKRKADALAERILQINPHAMVIRQHCLIQDVDTGLLAEFCRGDTIFVGAADNYGGNLYACERSKEYGASFVAIGCWERACAGNIFYYLSPDMADYGEYLDAIGHDGREVMQNRQFYTSEEDLAKVSFEPGISADINFVTIVAVKLILDILNRNTEGHRPRLLPHLTQFTLVCNTNDPEIAHEDVSMFSYPLQVTTSLYIPRRSGTVPPATPEHSHETR